MSEIPHAREIQPQGPTTDLSAQRPNNEDIINEQKSQIVKTLEERAPGQTQFHIELNAPLATETAKMLSERGYSYSTSSTVVTWGSQTEQKHILVFGAAQTPQQDRRRLLLQGPLVRWPDFCF